MISPSSVCMSCEQRGHSSMKCPELHSSLNKGFYSGQRIQDDDDHDHDTLKSSQHSRTLWRLTQENWRHTIVTRPKDQVQDIESPFL